MKRLDEIFAVRYCKSLELINCEKADAGVRFISRTSNNNGVVATVKELKWLKPMPPHAITVALGGSVLSSFYQGEPFYTAFHIACLYPQSPMSKAEMLYYCAAIEQNKFRYSYGRQANKTLRTLLVPSPEEVPAEIKERKIESPLTTNPALPVLLALDTSNWKSFSLGRLFNIQKGKRLTKADMIPGAIRYIGAIDSNNGVSAHIANKEHLHDPNTITVSYNGSIAETFYQEEPFWATDDVNVLYPRFDMNRYRAMFLCAIIEREKYRFSYGRKWDKELMVKSRIRLPATPDGKPDWKWMENYIKGLPYSAAL